MRPSTGTAIVCVHLCRSKPDFQCSLNCICLVTFQTSAITYNRLVKVIDNYKSKNERRHQDCFYISLEKSAEWRKKAPQIGEIEIYATARQANMYK